MSKAGHKQLEVLCILVIQSRPKSSRNPNQAAWMQCLSFRTHIAFEHSESNAKAP